jgi:hypothetical protein
MENDHAYDFIAIPEADAPAVEPSSSTSSTYTSGRTRRRHVAGRAGRLRLRAAREVDPIRTIWSTNFFGAQVLRSVRGHRGAACRRTALREKPAVQAYIDKYIGW